MNGTRSIRTLALTLVAVLIGSCSSPPREALTSCQQVQIEPPPAKTDILFVVDDSGSMAGNQANLAANLKAFIDRLAASPVKIDYQIGVTTTSVHRYVRGTNSNPPEFLDTFPPTNDCDPVANANEPYPAGALVRIEGRGEPCSRKQFTTGPRILATDSPTLAADFANNVFVGISGSFKEQGLEAARLALSEPLLSGANAGFVRPGSKLAVVIISDADDCSDPGKLGTSDSPPGCTPTSVDEYIQFFNGPIGGEVRDLVIGAIIPVDPVTKEPAQCGSRTPPPDVEHAAPRYRDFTRAFPHAVVDSICNDSFHDALVNIAGLIDPGQTMPLSGTPADLRLLTVRVMKSNGSVVPCQVGASGDSSANVIYAPPTAIDPATLTFGGACSLQQGDQVDVKVLCAG